MSEHRTQVIICHKGDGCLFGVPDMDSDWGYGCQLLCIAIDGEGRCGSYRPNEPEPKGETP